MRSPLKVFFTIDVEVYPICADWKQTALKEDIDRDIYGLIDGEEFGLRYQIKMLNKFGLRAVFFQEGLFASCPEVGPEPLRAIVREMQNGGHDVQLHLHPEWTPHIPSLAHIAAVPIAELPIEHQRELLRVGIANLVGAGAKSPRAFRGGDFSASHDTLTAASACGIEFDSSYNYCYRDSTSTLAAGNGRMLQPHWIDQVCELPISMFEDRPNHFRHTQICATSFREMRSALEEAYEKGWGTFVILSHSFEMINHRRSKRAPSLQPIIRRRFEDLCSFLAENKSRFETCVFTGLDAASITRGEPANPLKGSIMQTAFRYAEQAAGRIW